MVTNATMNAVIIVKLKEKLNPYAWVMISIRIGVSIIDMARLK